VRIGELEGALLSIRHCNLLVVSYVKARTSGLMTGAESI
jgi:hypothetical protein